MVDPTCESLATKASVDEVKDDIQELKNKINQLLGEPEEGEGQIDVIELGSLEGTKIAGGTALGLTAIQKIGIAGDVGGDFLGALARGTAKFEKTVGRGAKSAMTGLAKVGTTLGKNGKVIAATATAATVSAEVASVTMALATQAAQTYFTIKTLDLIKMNSENNAQAFNQWNADYTTLINILSQQNMDIEAANEKFLENEQKFEEQKVINQDQYQQLLQAAQTIGELQTANQNYAEQIQQANTTLANFQAEVNAQNEELGEAIVTINEQNATVQQQLDKAETIIGVQTKTIEQLQLQVDEQEARITFLEDAYIRLSDISAAYRAELFQLSLDVEQENNLQNAQIKSLGARLFLAERNLTSGSVGGDGGAAVREAANTQNKVLDLTSNLAGLGSYSPTVTPDNIYNNTNDFEQQYTDLITQVTTEQGMNQEQIDDFRNTLLDDFSNLTLPGLGLTLVGGIAHTYNQTTPTAISNAVTSGVCSTTAPGGCMSQNVTNPINNNIGKLVNSAGTAFSAANFAILNAMQPILNTVNATTQATRGIANATLGVVSHATHGLQAIQNFASKAWEATGADKILNGITTALVIHNGVQLSTNLTATIGETASVVLDAMGIQDEAGNAIDVNGKIRAKMNALMTSLIGAEEYAALSAKLATYNRIYQAGANVLDASRDLFDSARSTAELTAGNTGRIGNALLESGVVSEDSYSEMVEKINPQSRVLSRIEGFRDNLDSIEDTVSTVSSIASEVVSTKDSYKELLEARDEWNTTNQELRDARAVKKEATKLESEVTAEVEDIDFEPGVTQG